MTAGSLCLCSSLTTAFGKRIPIDTPLEKFRRYSPPCLHTKSWATDESATPNKSTPSFLPFVSSSICRDDSSNENTYQLFSCHRPFEHSVSGTLEYMHAFYCFDCLFERIFTVTVLSVRKRSKKRVRGFSRLARAHQGNHLDQIIIFSS